MGHTTTKTILAWSSGKDSAWALHVLRQDPAIDVVGLLTTVNADADRVAMHAVRADVLQMQAQAVGLPVHIAEIPENCSNADYDAAMGAAINTVRSDGVTAIAFGDLFLQDIRSYREQRLAETGITPLFPLWGKDTSILAHEMIDNGLRAVITCVDTNQIATELVGRTFDDDFVADLPAAADPCGENGEFHSFAYSGPMFNTPLIPKPGKHVTRGQFVFADLTLSEQT